MRVAQVSRSPGEFADIGEQSLKNIARPIGVYRVIAKRPLEARPSALPLPDKPSIAVLPFQNISGDPEQEYFADGMVEEIITALSRIRHRPQFELYVQRPGGRCEADRA